MNLELTPTMDRVLIRREATTGRTRGGILLPDSAKSKPCRGIIVAVGPGKIMDNGVHRPLPWEVGTEVLFNSFGAVPLTDFGLEHGDAMADSDLVVVMEPDILLVIT